MSVTEVLHGELTRHRAQGTSFTNAWPQAATAALSAACDRDEWISVTRGAWQRAYERQPAPRRELACGVLHNRSEGIPIPDGRTCAECELPLPPTAHANRKVCPDCLGARRLRQNLEYNRARREPIAA